MFFVLVSFFFCMIQQLIKYSNLYAYLLNYAKHDTYIDYILFLLDLIELL